MITLSVDSRTVAEPGLFVPVPMFFTENVMLLGVPPVIGPDGGENP